MMETDVLIIGSGPTGVSAAWPLVSAGLSVTMIDAGSNALPHSPRISSLNDWRKDHNHWRDILGDDLGGLDTENSYSPKFSTPVGRAVIGGCHTTEPKIRSNNMVVSRASTPGGLSTIWGAFCPTYDDTDLARFPISAHDLAEGYRSVASRIGISVIPTGDLTKPVQHVFERYNTQQRVASFSIDRAQNAVLSTDQDDRKACIRCGMCLYGCGHKSIYNSRDELSALRQHTNFRYIPHAVARKLVSSGDNQQIVELEIGKEIILHTSRFLLLAAGTLNSTALILDHFGMFNQSVRLLSNPVAGMSFVVPKLIGTPAPDQSFSLGQLSYQLDARNNQPQAAGVVYGADTLPLNLFAQRMPLSRPTSLRLSAALTPAILMATCYLPGQYSHNTLTLERSNGENILALEGTTPKATRNALLAAGKTLAKRMRALGAYRIPGSMTISPPGSDAHLTGTIPMDAKQPLSCNKWCEITGTQDVYVVDGSWFPDLPAKHCTFTLMANAHRIGSHIAQKFSTHA